jgi:hypothetical protein
VLNDCATCVSLRLGCAAEEEDLPLTANCFSMSSKLSAFSALMVPVGVWTDILARYAVCIGVGVYGIPSEWRAECRDVSRDESVRCGHFLQMTHWQRIKFRRLFWRRLEASCTRRRCTLHSPSTACLPRVSYMHTASLTTWNSTRPRASLSAAEAARDEHEHAEH